MALGLPSQPPDAEDFVEAPDEYCPSCGWDSSESALDVQKAHNQGVLLAIEEADGSPFTAMGGAQLLAFYWKCPGTIVTNGAAEDLPQPHPEDVTIAKTCGTLFTTEEENSLGSMA